MVGKVNYTLCELVEKYNDIVESKKNDGRMIEQKEKTWQIISQQFNAWHGVSERTAKQLKECWKNIKRKAKSEVSEDKKERRKTGGGEKSDDGISSISQKVIELLPQQINSLTNPYDGDAVYHGDGLIAQQKASMKDNFVGDYTIISLTPCMPRASFIAKVN